MKLSGPEFLLFYVGLTVVVCGAGRLFRYLLEDGEAGYVDTSNPYRLAILRGGAVEAVRLGVAQLIDEGYFVVADRLIVMAPAAPTAPPAHEPLRTLVNDVRARGRVGIAELASAAPFAAWVRDMQQSLTADGLLVGRLERWVRWTIAASGSVVLFCVAWTRLANAAAAGRHNTGILSLLQLVAPLVCCLVVLRNQRTRRGDRAIADLRDLMAEVPRGPAPANGVWSRDMLLLGAVFGVAALAPFGVASADVVILSAATGGSSCSSSSCSAGSDGGGGGCGGGGCGGGCGG